MDDYERILLVKPDVHVYKIPPRVSNRAYRASDWNLDQPDWNCRLRLISKGNECFIKLDEKSTGQFFGKCPIDKYPGNSIESVSDSSRYFVLRLFNEQTNRTAFVGIGFIDRSDSFDLNVALQDYFKILNFQNTTSDSNNNDNIPKLDLKFKEGETIKVNINFGNKTNKTPRTKTNKSSGVSGIGLLPPPPGSSNKNPSSSTSTTTKLIENFDSLNLTSTKNEQEKNLTMLNNDNDSVPSDDKTSNNNNDDLWSDFTSCNKNNDNDNKDGKEKINQFDNWAKF